jgi:hypothetical protein
MFASFRNWLRRRGRNRRPFRLTARQASARNCYRPLLEKLEDRLTPSAAFNDSYVAVLYQGLLGRPAEVGGQGYWTNLLNSGAPYTQVAKGVLGSQEYQTKQVQGLYQNLLGRAADSGGLNFWVGQEQAGTPSDQVAADILGTAEFYNHAGGTLDGFVRTIYRDELGRDLDSVGASFFGTQVLTGTPRDVVALEILHSTEARQRQVINLYRQDLGRSPEAGGQNYWIGALQGGMTAEGVSANLLGSGEFLGLLRPFVAGVTTTDPNVAAGEFLSAYQLLGVTAPQPGVSTVISSVVVQAPDFVTQQVPVLQIQVTASDPSLIDPGIHIDVDLRHDGSFTDPGDMDFAAGTYTGDGTTVTLTRPLAQGIYSLRARVFDQLGNVATSAPVSMQVDPNEGFIGSQALLDLAYGLPYGTPVGSSSGANPTIPPDGGAGGGSVTPRGPRPSQYASLFEFDSQGRVDVSVRSTLGKYLDGLETDLKGLGMVVTTVTPAQNMVTGFLPVDQILNLPNLAHFAAADPVIKPVTRFGPVATQGDALILGPQFRASQNVNGAGVKVGILSDSINQVVGPGSLTGIAASQAVGALPPSGVQVLKDFTGSGATDEGRAMAEIVYAVAPGAGLAFYTGFNSPQDFANGINALAGAGAKVITDDIGYADSPMFNDGIIAQAVDSVVANGVFYTSAAGNNQNSGWQRDWSPVQVTIGGVTGTYADTGGGNPLQNFTLPVGSSTQIAFDWDSAFLEGGSPLPNFKVNNEIDALVVNPNTLQTIKTFNSNPMNMGEATQFIDFTNDGTFGTNTFAFAFKLASGPAPTKLRWVLFGGTDPMAVGEGGPTIFGQPAAAGAVAAGAVDWRKPTVNEGFSAFGGPLNFLFDLNGNRLPAPETRFKPEVSAPDGVFTTFFGQQLAGEAFPSFFGTSAATPHVAAAAALLLQQAPGTLPAALTLHLEQTAKQIATPVPDPTGGFGLIQLTPLPVTPPGGPPGGPPQPGFPGDQFDPNDSSDTAHDFGAITTGYNASYSNLSIIILNGGLPEYDWYRWEPSTDGTFTAALGVDAGQGLEIHLWGMVGGYLTELNRAVVNSSTGNTGSVSFHYTAGQVIFVEVKGINIAPGVQTTGLYHVAFTYG